MVWRNPRSSRRSRTTRSATIPPVFYARQFPPHVRYTGVGVAQQTSYVVLGFIPAICTALLGDGELGWLVPALFMFAIAAIAVGCRGTTSDKRLLPWPFPAMTRKETDREGRRPP